MNLDITFKPNNIDNFSTTIHIHTLPFHTDSMDNQATKPWLLRPIPVKQHLGNGNMYVNSNKLIFLSM